MATPVATIGRVSRFAHQAKPTRLGRTQVVAALLLATSVSCADFGEDPGPLLPDAGTGVGLPGPSGTGGATVPPISGTGGTGAVPAPGAGGSVAPPAGDAGAGGRTGTGGSGPADGPPAPPTDTAAPPTPGGECPASASFGILLSIDVSWPGSAATMGGTGVVRLWNRADLVANGNTMTGTVTPCGSTLPETTLTGLGRVAAGGNKILIEIPGAIWDMPSIPKFTVTGMRSSAALPSMIQFELVAPLGFTPTDPRAAWPDSYTALKDLAKDIDGDGGPGYASQPKGTDGYVLPPTALGLGGLAPAAEKVFLINRNITTFTGMRTSCDAFSGTANVQAFDSHVVGCMVKGGMPCNDKQIDFVDQNRMKYAPKSATFKAQVMPANSTCADVRRVLAP